MTASSSQSNGNAPNTKYQNHVVARVLRMREKTLELIQRFFGDRGLDWEMPDLFEVEPREPVSGIPYAYWWGVLQMMGPIHSDRFKWLSMDLWESESLFPNPNRNGVGEKHPHTGSYAKITKQQMGSSCSIEQLPIPGRRGDFPSIKIPIEAHKRGLDRNKFNLVGRLDLTKIKIAEVRLIAFALWKPKGVCRIVPIGKETQKNSHALCWVKFPGLGFEFWEVDSLMALGRTMGTPIHVDRTHSNFGYFAKVLVDIDLAEPIPNKVLVEVEDGDFWQKVELGSLPKFRPHCKMVGHNLSECRDGQNHGAASACKEGVASKTSGNRPIGAKEGADSISQIIRETSLILLHKDENWTDMVEDEERDEACIVRRVLWKDLIDVSNLNLPWLALGDFSIIRLQSERFGSTGPTLSAIKEFNGCLDECELIESPSAGMKLTWCNGQSGGDRISRRLDRALYNGMWAGKYDGWKVKALARENSDHSALVGEPNPIPKPKNIPFRFLKCWIELLCFQDLIKTSWEAAQAGNPIIKLMKKLQRLKTDIKQWRKTATGAVRKLVTVSWDKVCKPEEESDLGILSLKSINLALLMKMGWGFLTSEEQGAEFFRAKYIKKNGELINYFKHSSIWPGLKGVMKYVKNNSSWMIGNGCTIDLWRDCWGADLPLMEEVSVENLDVNCNLHDKRVWRHHTQGAFTVQSAHEDIRSKNPKVWWNKYMHCKAVHPKAKYFLWRTCHNVLATEDNLRLVIGPVSDLQLPSQHERDAGNGRQDELVYQRPMESHGDTSFTAYLARVKLDYFQRREVLQALIKEAASLSNNWMSNTVLDLQIVSKLGVHVRAQPLPCIASCRWKLPWLEEVKINCNSSTLGNPGKAGLGLIARNHSGDVLGARTKGLGVLCRPEAECYAMLEAMI
ncbi:hypothetical protein GIB67_011562 [Kingdonia uniflora]|uniref:Reverse transcriptase zinc-binding domain-containing protein n=1 Tax=Kingdonia uniflora TaxID=39325 RepID=A0A7J7NLV4_9MAGN|nr:hypothetical protein GIB67_011562 [Kingdonia uniflora]